MNDRSPATTPASTILFFDGECPACNRFIGWLAIQGSLVGELRFSSLQGAAGQAVLLRLGRCTGCFDSIVLLHRGQLLENRAAFIALGQMHTGAARWLAALRWLPDTLVVLTYRAVGRRRYLWGGACPLPSAPIRERLGLSPSLEREVVLWAAHPDNTVSSRSGRASARSKSLGALPKN